MLFYLKRLLMAKKKVNRSFLFFSTFIIIFISIGFSALNQNLLISGDVNYYINSNKLYDVLKRAAKVGTYAKEYTGEHQDSFAGDGTEKIYHWYATSDEDGTAIQNMNNVIFANHCWQMIRTTDTGGVKMIYNGEVDNNQCLNTRGTHVGYSQLIGTLLSTTYYYGTDYIYDSTNNVFSLSGNVTTGTIQTGQYTCKSTLSTGTCSTIYLVDTPTSTSTNYPVFPLKSSSKYSQFGTLQYNRSDKSPAHVGYMYNIVYPTIRKDNTFVICQPATINTSYYYSDTIDYNNITSGQYTLTNPSLISTLANNSDLIGKYVLSKSGTTDIQARYVVAVEGTKYYYKNLIEGDLNTSLTIGDTYSESGGVYTLSGNVTNVPYITWYNTSDLSVYTGKYVCNGNNTSCTNLKHIYSGNDSIKNSFIYCSVDKNTYSYAESVSYDGTTYTLTGDIKTFWDYYDSTNQEYLSTHHYTCLENGSSCTTVSYINFLSYDMSYSQITGAENVDVALNNMLYANDVNTKNSNIKTAIEAWYAKYLSEYDSYIEDTIFCNNRTIGYLGTWNPDGGPVMEMHNHDLRFKGQSSNNKDLSCDRDTDKFSTLNTSAQLTYKVGLMSNPEMNLLRNNKVRVTGSKYWLFSPHSFKYGDAIVNAVGSSGGWDYEYVSVSQGVRPAISLKPGTEYVSGDGSMANPYIVDASPMIYTTTFENDSWETIVAAIKNGQYDSYNVGDTKQVDLGSLGTHTLRIANNSSPSECEANGFSQTACGFVLEFVDIITKRRIGSSATGGWPASEIRTYLNSTVYNALPEVIRNAVITTNAISGYEYGASTNYKSKDKIYLLSSVEIAGVNNSFDSVTLNHTRQLDYYSKIGANAYFRIEKEYNSTVTAWWMRSAASNQNNFWLDRDIMEITTYSPTQSQGISPAFRIGTSFDTDSWETIVSNVKSGNIGKYKVGDEKEVNMGSLGTHTLRIANISNPDACETEGFSQTACGFVLEFADLIGTRAMNSSATNVGGWPGTTMRTYLNNDVYNALPEALRNGIIYTDVVSGHGSTSGETNFTTTDKLYLLSSVEIYGANYTYDSLQTTGTRQLDYYSSIGLTTSNYSGAIKKNGTTATIWKLRSARSNNATYYTQVSAAGARGTGSATTAHGVSPAFRIGKSFTTDSWETIVSNVQNGSTDYYKVGDIKEVDLGDLGVHNLRLVNKSTPSECETNGFSQTACGFVLEFADAITKRRIKAGDNTDGGWPTSEIRTYLNSTVYNAIPETIRNAIINTDVVSGYGCSASSCSNSGYYNNGQNYSTVDKLYLFSPNEIREYSNIDFAVTLEQTRQLDYYRENGVVRGYRDFAVKKFYNNTEVIWWLRDPCEDQRYYWYDESSDGEAMGESPTTSQGVAPAFRIG